MTFKFCFAASVAVVVGIVGTASAAKAPPRTETLKDGELTVQVEDLSPRFLAFYAAAKTAPDAQARFRIWQETDGFAAVPPTPAGELMARRIVDAAWPRYAEAVANAKAGAAGMSPAPMPILRRVAAILQLNTPATIKLITYIGGFEDNAFSYRGEVPTVAVPLEIDPRIRARSLAHEGTHALQMVVDNLSGGWERSVAATMLLEGLAMQVSREAVPGYPFESYVSQRPGWWQACTAKDHLILEELRDKLARSDSDTVMSVTIDKAPKAGVEREAYYGGWRIVDWMHGHGMSFAQIARIPEADMPMRVRTALDHILSEPPPK